MKRSIIFGWLFFSFFILSNIGYAASIGVSPKKIEFFEEDKEKQITLYNPNDYKVSFVIKAQNGSFIKFPTKGEIDAKNSTTIIVIKSNGWQYLPETKDRVTIAFFDDNKDMLDIITSASVDVVLHKDTGDAINLIGNNNESHGNESENGTFAEAKGIFSVSSILTMVAVLVVVGIFVWLMVMP